MEGNIIIQAVKIENFMEIFTNKTVAKIKEQSNWIALSAEAIPHLTTTQAAMALGCSPKFVKTIYQRYPEKLKPIFEEDSKRPVYCTKQVLTLRQNGGYK